MIAKLQENGMSHKLANRSPGADHVSRGYDMFLYLCHNAQPNYIDHAGLLRTLPGCDCSSCKYSCVAMERVPCYLPEDFDEDLSEPEKSNAVPLQWFERDSLPSYIVRSNQFFLHTPKS